MCFRKLIISRDVVWLGLFYLALNFETELFNSIAHSLLSESTSSSIYYETSVAEEMINNNSSSINY
jgi:hypothetical protein